MTDTFILSVHPVPMSRSPCAPYSRDNSNLASFGDSKKTLRVVVKDLFPITYLTNPEDLRVAFKDIIKCHQSLVNVAKILHREINVNNLMYCQKDDKKCGILRDFDLLSTMEENRQATSKKRMGTKPFMAMDLLAPKKVAGARHFVRYDLESTVYIFAWIICRYENRQEIKNPPFEEWCYGSWESVRDEKCFWIHSSIFETPPTSQCASLALVLVNLARVLRQGLAERSNHDDLRVINPILAKRTPLQEETLNDRVTYKTILDAFDSPPPYTEFPEPATPE
ncbi:hypothetical protein L218DRAFT_951254 [Marasmius fiardii PR-910]|nr:hypothetical protein L218DRAFT_951254 [Marasmius fiardii PR-910]